MNVHFIIVAQVKSVLIEISAHYIIMLDYDYYIATEQKTDLSVVVFVIVMGYMI